MFSGSFRSLLFVVALVFSAVLALSQGCATAPQTGPCSDDSECPVNQSCQNEKCRPMAFCTPANEQFVCRPNEECVGGVCQPRENPLPSPPKGCQTNADCTAPKVCNRSTEQCVDCLTNEDCEQGETCNSTGQCTKGQTNPELPPDENPIPDQKDETQQNCRDDLDCPPEQKCDLLEKKCIQRNNKKCTLDKECPKGSYCGDGLCQEGRRPCDTSKPCQADNDCRSGQCYPKKCTADDDCDSNRICDTTAGTCFDDCNKVGCNPNENCNATTKKCEPKAPADCTTTGCQNGETCDPNTKKCVPPSGTDCTTTGCPTGQKCDLTTKKCVKNGSQTCTTNNDCKTPTGSCRSGKCESCATQFQCPAGQNCDLSTGRCKIKPCSNDGECNPPAGSCQSGQCKTCGKDFQCPANTKCDTSTGRCKSTACIFSSDCGNPKEFCKSRVCTPKQCGSGSGKTCPSGQRCSFYQCQQAPFNRKSCRFSSCSSSETCLNITSSTSYCFKKCTSNANCSNPTHPQECLEISLASGKKEKLCVLKASKTQGQTCDSLDRRCAGTGNCLFDRPNSTSGRCFNSCPLPAGTGCKSTEVCHEFAQGKGACLIKGTRTKGQTCGFTSSRCNDKHTCLTPTSTATSGKCYLRCPTPGSSTGCASTESCLSLRSSSSYGACIIKGTRTEGQSCGGLDRRCKSGMVCTNTGSTTICLHGCSGKGTTGDRQCRLKTSLSYRTCYDLQRQGGVCYR